MSEKMYPIPFKSLMNWIVTEYAREGEIFGVHTPYYATGKTLPIFGETIETPFGPAAGPNSQLAQKDVYKRQIENEQETIMRLAAQYV